MPKVLFQLYIEVEQFQYVDKKAKEKGRSRAALVREMIAEKMKEERAEK